MPDADTPLAPAQTPPAPVASVKTTPPQQELSQEAIAQQEDAAQSRALTTGEPKLLTQRRPSRALFFGEDGEVGHTDPYPVSLTFLSGLYEGQVMRIGQWLGAAAPEPSHSWGAEWKERESSGILPGVNFSKLSDRTFQVKLYFYDLQEDIAYLGEQMACLTQIDPEEGMPPMLLYRQGDLIIQPVVCASVSVSYKEPYSGDRGYKIAEADLQFKVVAGMNSPHAHGGPLLPVALTAENESLSDEQREERGRQRSTQLVLAPCLGEEGNEELTELLEEPRHGQASGLEDPAQVANLSEQTLVQLAVSGMIPTEVLQDARVQEHLRKAVLGVMAANENGLTEGSRQRSPERFAAALMSGRIGSLPADLQPQALAAGQDYGVILEAILSGDLGEEAAVFQSPTAGDRLRRMASCGLTLRQTQGVSTDSEADAAVVQSINQFLADSSHSLQDIRDRFGLRSDAQARLLRNGSPYESKRQFMERGGDYAGSGVSAMSAWAHYQQSQPEEAAAPADGEELSEEPIDDETL